MRIGLFTDALPDRPLPDVLDFLKRAAPQVTDVEIGLGGYSPARHANLGALLADAGARQRWQAGVLDRGFRISALNVSGNPLHPDATLARRDDQALRDTIRLAAALGVDRVVAMSGCPGAGDSDRVAPHFVAGGWLPDLERIAPWQWQERVLPYWRELSDFARREQPSLRICLELHPGTFVYNVETFSSMARVGDNIGVNLDPSHLFWQLMDPLAVVERIGDRIGHAHGKDTTFRPDNLALNGVLDNRWPGKADEMPWNFSTVGRGHDVEWWRRFVQALAAASFDGTISIEYEDPFMAAEASVVEAASVLDRAMAEVRTGSV
jgi:sugar phosphate isomerase/epimerase